MMKKKIFIALFLCLLFLFIPGHKVKAMTWGEPYRAIVTQPKRIYWYSFYAPNWKEHKGHPKTLPTGKMITVTRHYGFGTMVTGKGLAHHSTIDKETFWMVPNYSRSWYDIYSKHVILDAGLFTGASKRIGKHYTFTWKQYCKLVRMGLWTSSITNRFRHQIRIWHLKPHYDN